MSITQSLLIYADTSKNHLTNLLGSDIVKVGGATLFQNYFIGRAYYHGLFNRIEQIVKKGLKNVGGYALVGAKFHTFRSWEDQVMRIMLAYAFVKTCCLIKYGLDRIPAPLSTNKASQNE
jgi:hypothetical protein